MESLLRTVTKRLEFHIPVLKKYVDDLILALPLHLIQHTLEVFNNYNQHIQFTVEKEDNGRLPFLDTQVIRHDDQTLSTKWYSKPISSGRLLNYRSFHSTSMKINVAANFIKRVFALTTDETGQQQSSIIYQHLRQNNYPSSLINRLTNRIRQSRIRQSTIQSSQQPDNRSPSYPTPPPLQINQPDQPNEITTHQAPTTIQSAETTTPAAHHQLPRTQSTDNNTTRHNNDLQPIEPRLQYRCIPYIPLLSPTIASILKIDFPQVKISYKTLKTTKNILRSVKDPVDTLDQCNVIYSLSCTNCQKTYIGMTRNHLKTRISGHRNNINEYTKLIQNNNTNIVEDLTNLIAKTALMKHIIEENHTA